MLFRLVLLAAFLGHLGLLLGQGLNTTTSAAAPSAVVKGSVISLRGGAVRYASLSLTAQDSRPGSEEVRYTTEADDQGKFIFDDIPAGRYVLAASRPGYLYRLYGSKKATSAVAEILQAEAGKTLGDLTVTMVPQGMIGGKITDESGEPVENATVRVFSSRFLRGRRMMNSAAFGQTVADGSFAIGGLYPGRYYVQAVPPNGLVNPNERAGTRQRFAKIRRTFYGNSSDASLAVPIQLEAGTEFRGANIDMIRAVGYEVSGRLSAAAERASTVTLMPVDPLGTITGADELKAMVGAGSDAFDFKDVPPGDYELMVRPSSPPGPRTGALMVQVRNADLSGLNVPPIRETTLLGSVMLENGLENGLVRNDAGILPAQITLMNEAGAMEPALKVGSQGTFYDAHVRVGTYQLSLPFIANGGYYLKSMRLNGVALQSGAVTLPDAVQSRLDIVISPRAAAVSGTVRDVGRQPVGAAHVVTWPVAPVQRDAFFILPIPEQFSAKNGEYETGSLAPGEYYVAAFEDPGFLPFQSYQFLTQFEARAVKIKVEEGAHATAELTLIDGTAIEAAEALLP